MLRKISGFQHLVGAEPKRFLRNTSWFKCFLRKHRTLSRPSDGRGSFGTRAWTRGTSVFHVNDIGAKLDCLKDTRMPAPSSRVTVSSRDRI